MIRKAFVMSVNAGSEGDYQLRHNPIWPELEHVLKTHGVHKYSIFLLPQTRQLFAYAEIEDQTRWESIASTSECRRWWRHMAEIMPHNGDDSPLVTDLKEVFNFA